MKGLLLRCGALAAGEYLASFVPNYADVWPLAVFLAAVVALFGYGLCLRGWPCVFFALLGVALFLRASAADERLFREKPWLRGRLRQERRTQFRQADFAHGVKKDFARRIAIGLEDGNETVCLNRAILLGERRCLSPQMRRIFVESGTMHVFAISGLHVMAIAELLTYLLALAFVPRRLVGLVAVPLLWFYVYMIGLPPSAVRAAVMATFWSLSPLFWRKSDGLRSWALTFFLVHLVSPRLIVNVGNVLSFAVMLAVVLAGSWGRDLARWKRALLVTVVAWAAGAPIAAHVFGRVTPGGMVANLVLVATARVTVVSGAVGVLASYVSETAAAHFNNLSSLTVRLMVLVADGVSRLPGGNFVVDAVSVSDCFVWYGLLALAMFGAVRCRTVRRPI